MGVMEEPGSTAILSTIDQKKKGLLACFGRSCGTLEIIFQKALYKMDSCVNLIVFWKLKYK